MLFYYYIHLLLPARACEIFLYGRFVYTPVTLTDGDTVLFNPCNDVQPSSHQECTDTGEVSCHHSNFDILYVLILSHHIVVLCHIFWTSASSMLCLWNKVKFFIWCREWPTSLKIYSNRVCLYIAVYPITCLCESGPGFYICLDVCMYVDLLSTCIHTYMYICMYVCLCICMYIYLCTYLLYLCV